MLQYKKTFEFPHFQPSCTDYPWCILRRELLYFQSHFVLLNFHFNSTLHLTKRTKCIRSASKAIPFYDWIFNEFYEAGPGSRLVAWLAGVLYTSHFSRSLSTHPLACEQAPLRQRAKRIILQAKRAESGLGRKRGSGASGQSFDAADLWYQILVSCYDWSNHLILTD